MRLVTIVSICLMAAPLFAGDVWMVQGYALAATPSPLYFTVWSGDALFFNTTDVPVTIRLINTSDAPIPLGQPTSFSIRAHQAATLDAAIAGGWQPASSPPIWVDHIDVPDGVRIESRLELSVLTLFGPPPPVGSAPMFGKLSFPIVRSLAPPGQQQLFLGADNSRTDSRINIGVYNGGTVLATAHLEVRRACDDTVVASQEIIVGANSLSQVSLHPRQDAGPCADTRALTWENYALVMVDQPSFSYVSTLLNHPLETTPPVLRIPAAIVFNQ